jgi:hypothetical protein
MATFNGLWPGVVAREAAYPAGDRIESALPAARAG